MGAYFYHKGKIFPLIFYMMCSTEKVFAVQVCPALFSRGFRSSKAYDFDFMVHLMNHTTTPSHLIMDSLGELHSQQEAAPSDQLMDLETEAVMKERVASSTRKGYDGRNISLMIWLFDSNGQQYHYLLEPHIFGKMVEAQHKDSNMLTKNRTHSKKRFYLRAVCRLALTSMNPGVASTIPIKLDILSFTIFTRFLSTFKKRVTKRTSPEASTVDDSATIRLSPSSYDAACSALSHLFTESGISKEENESTKELWTKLGAYKKGTRRLGVKEKDKMGLSTDEGKKPLPFTAYKYLAKVLFESSKAEHVAAHTFLIIEWNLISRAEFVVNSKIDSIRCHGDAILFCMGKTKTDQEGTKNIDHPWHVYANNECAYICPVLALARHLITNPKILVGNCPLFEGSGQYDRYNHILNEIVSSDEHRNMFVALGMPPQHFGTHSIRKGAVTHISTGTTSNPPIASICLRANWAMPGVMNRYIKHENAGDQFVGKCVSGRSRLSKEFAASQAYFDFSLLTRAEKERNEKVIDCWIQSRMPEAARSNEKVFALFKMCVASLAYHRHFLEENLHSRSNVRVSVFYLEQIPLVEHVTIAYPWNKTSDTPEVTGIPPDVLIMAEFESMRIQLREMKASITGQFAQTLRKELDDREVGGIAYAKMTEMMAKMDSMMSMLTKKERENRPTASAFFDEIDNILEESAHFELSNEEDEDIVLPFVDDGTLDQLTSKRTSQQLKARKFTIGYHHGKLNPLPSTWRYPKGITLIQLINLWLLGVNDQNVPPLGKVNTQWVYHFDTKARDYSKMKQVMKFVETFGKQRGVWVEGTRVKWDGAFVTTLWDAIWEDFIPYMCTKTTMQKGDGGDGDYISNHKSRTGQAAWRSIYNKLVDANKLCGNKKRRKKQ